MENQKYGYEIEESKGISNHSASTKFLEELSADANSKLGSLADGTQTKVSETNTDDSPTSKTDGRHDGDPVGKKANSLDATKCGAKTRNSSDSGEGSDPKQRSSETSDQEKVEKSAEEEDEEKRNDDPYPDQNEDDEQNASDQDRYVKREAGPAVKDGPATKDEEVPTQILVMKDGRPVPRSHGTNAGQEKVGLPNPAYEQTLLIESLWR